MPTNCLLAISALALSTLPLRAGDLTIEGRVIYETDGSPAIGKDIYVTGHSTWAPHLSQRPSHKVSQAVTTREDGGFQLTRFLPREYQLYFQLQTPEGWTYRNYQFFTPKQKDQELLTIELITGQVLTGGIIDYNGKSVPDTTVRISGRGFARRGRTDDNGRFSIRVPPGRYQAEAILPPDQYSPVVEASGPRVLSQFCTDIIGTVETNKPPTPITFTFFPTSTPNAIPQPLLDSDIRLIALRTLTAWFVEGKPLPGNPDAPEYGSLLKSGKHFFVDCNYFANPITISDDPRVQHIKHSEYQNLFKGWKDTAYLRIWWTETSPDGSQNTFFVQTDYGYLAGEWFDITFTKTKDGLQTTVKGVACK